MAEYAQLSLFRVVQMIKLFQIKNIKKSGHKPEGTSQSELLKLLQNSKPRLKRSSFYLYLAKDEELGSRT